MNFQEWVETYKPVMNKDAEIFGFETYGGYLDFIDKQDNKNVWTLIDSDGILIIVAGKRWVNRLNYFVTENKWEDRFDFVTLADEDSTNIFYSF